MIKLVIVVEITGPCDPVDRTTILDGLNIWPSLIIIIRSCRYTKTKRNHRTELALKIGGELFRNCRKKMSWENFQVPREDKQSL